MATPKKTLVVMSTSMAASIVFVSMLAGVVTTIIVTPMAMISRLVMIPIVVTPVPVAMALVSVTTVVVTVAIVLPLGPIKRPLGSGVPVFNTGRWSRRGLQRLDVVRVAVCVSVLEHFFVCRKNVAV